MVKISVIIPTYNCARYVCAAIDSVLNQTYRDFEIIIVDDGSTDATKETIKGYMDKIKYIYQENRGPSAARNTGIKAARGEYITFLDADDYWDPKFFELMMEAIGQNDSDISVCDNYRIELRNDSIVSKSIHSRSNDLEKKSILFESFLEKDLIGGPSRTISRKKIFDEIKGYDEKLRLHQEWDLWIRFFQSPRKVALVRQPLYYYHVRNNGSNITRRLPIEKSVSEIYYIYKKFNTHIKINKHMRKAFASQLWDCARELHTQGSPLWKILLFLIESQKLDPSVKRMLQSLHSQKTFKKKQEAL